MSDGTSEPAALDPVPLGDRFRAALTWATELHATQPRKGTTTPYVSHLLAVCGLVLEDGGDEDQAIAALLHDAVEDQGGAPVLVRIRERFGERVAGIVEACTDAWEQPKPPWRERKEAYLRHLETASADVLRVAAADKLHNARTVLADLRRHGEAVWQRFHAGRHESLWYLKSCIAVFQARGLGMLRDELERVVAEIERT